MGTSFSLPLGDFLHLFSQGLPSAFPFGTPTQRLQFVGRELFRRPSPSHSRGGSGPTAERTAEGRVRIIGSSSSFFVSCESSLRLQSLFLFSVPPRPSSVANVRTGPVRGTSPRRTEVSLSPNRLNYLRRIICFGTEGMRVGTCRCLFPRGRPPVE